MRSSRTPPFLIIALLIVVGFLSYNYWKFYNINSELRAEVEAVRIQARDTDSSKLESERNLNTAREEIKQIQGSRDALQKAVQEKDKELTTLKADLKKAQEELNGVKKSLGECDANLQTQKKEVDALKAEKAEFDKKLEAEKTKPQVCDLKSCSEPLKQILDISSKLTGTEQLSKALTEAKLNAEELLQNVPK
nr:Golgi membrane protein 1 isoform X2 [Biomphalaria glabrata]